MRDPRRMCMYKARTIRVCIVVYISARKRGRDECVDPALTVTQPVRAVAPAYCVRRTWIYRDEVARPESASPRISSFSSVFFLFFFARSIVTSIREKPGRSDLREIKVVRSSVDRSIFCQHFSRQGSAAKLLCRWISNFVVLDTNCNIQMVILFLKKISVVIGWPCDYFTLIKSKSVSTSMDWCFARIS